MQSIFTPVSEPMKVLDLIVNFGVNYDRFLFEKTGPIAVLSARWILAKHHLASGVIVSPEGIQYYRSFSSKVSNWLLKVYYGARDSDVVAERIRRYLSSINNGKYTTFAYTDG